ncbi:MAG: penicillin-insensitive murein endopeptidase, partial [Myxococcota bacterium]
LRGGIPMPDGPGRRIRRRGRSWGRPNLVVNLDHALNIYAKAYPEGPVVIVSDMSRRHGGRLKPHHTHREGQDVDLSYIPIPKHDNGGFIKMDKLYFDVERNWTFIKAMLDTGEVTLILMDHDLQKLLFEKARSEGIPVPELRRIFQYPRPKEREVAIIRHWDKHDDHMHVRFACHPDRRRCRR